MLKNIFAAIGLLVVVKKGFDFYCEYDDLKRENEFLRSHKERESTAE